MNRMFKRKNKKKSRSDSESKNASKVVTLDNAHGDLNGTNGSYEDAADSSFIQDFDRPPNAKDKKSNRIKRSGSKLLSLFRKWKSGSNHATRKSSSGSHARQRSSAATREIPLPLSRDAVAAETARLMAFFGTQSNPLPLEQQYPVRNGDEQVNHMQFLHDSPTSSFDTGSGVVYIPPGQKWAERCDSRLTGSSSSIPFVIPRKLSDPFLSPTVVHRPHRRARPSIRSINTDHNLLEYTGQGPAYGLDTTDLSTQRASANMYSPTGVSTGMTSMFPDGSGRQFPATKGKGKAPQQLARSKDATALEDLHINSLTPITEAFANRKPSIATVEITANTKVFFETHFNIILSTPVSPRSQRRHAFELDILSKPFTSEQKARMRAEWARQESQHLRELRSLMSRRSNKSGVIVGGYEVVNVLGKGSFGVVRLVKEKDPILEDQATSSIQDPNRLLTYPRSTVIDAIKSSVKSPKQHCHRRESTHVKNRYYAMKVIRKSNMLRSSQEGHLRAERDFLVASEGSRWIVPLIASFQDHTNLYLVMEYMVGGDFLGLLIREHSLDEDVTKWYVAEMILCVEEAHKLNWIHRDVKPDNFLISASGHLKISDFGLAFDGHWSHNQNYYEQQRYSLMEKLGIQVQGDRVDQSQRETLGGSSIAGPSKMPNGYMTGKGKHRATDEGTSDEGVQKERVLDWRNKHEMRSMAQSTVGTSQYMAPEIIRGDRYDGRCDWWSIGIIMYECLYGFTPFCMENREDTKQNILHHGTALSFPTDVHVSAQAIDLMRRLLREKEFRLSSRRYAPTDFLFPKNPREDDFGVYRDYMAAAAHARFVYPDDAEDIKAHSFFRNVLWDKLHLMRPPFVPKVKSWEDTRYFEEDEPISDVRGSSSYSNSRSRSSTSSNGVPQAAPNDQATTHQRPSLWNANEIHISAEQPPATEQPMTKDKENKPHKRPRDKILRDEVVGKQALEIRKKGAFLGYTWRRIRPRVTETESQSLQDLADKPKQRFKRKSLFSMS